MNAPKFQLVLTPTPGGVEPILRLRRALKALLRSYGLRCVSVQTLPDPLANAAGCVTKAAKGSQPGVGPPAEPERG